MKNRTLAITHFLFSVLCMHTTDVFVKLFGDGIHFGQSVFLRFLSASIMLMPLIFARGQKFKLLKVKDKSSIISRSLFLCLATGFWFVGIPVSSITNVTATAFFIPILTLCLSSLLLREKLTLFRGVSNILGFLGILIIVGFSDLEKNYGLYVLLIGAVFFALFAVASKKCADEENITTTLFYTSFISSLIALPVALYVWQPLTLVQFGVCLSLGVLANLNSYFLLKAYQLEEASFLTPFLYSEMIFSILSGLFIFSEPILGATIVGSLLVVFSNIFVCYEKKTVAVATE